MPVVKLYLLKLYLFCIKIQFIHIILFNLYQCEKRDNK